MIGPALKPGGVLVAVNFSDRSREAAKAAAVLAGRRGARLWVVHVLAPESVVVHEAALRMAAGALAHEAEPLRKLTDDVQTVVLSGRPHEALAKFCQEQEIALVVLGEAAPDEAFGGAARTAERALQTIGTPLLVVKQAAPFEAFATGPRKLKVVLGVDRSATTQAAVRWLEDLALSGLGPLEIVAVYLHWPFEEARRLGLPLPLDFETLSPPLRAALEEEVLQAVGTRLRSSTRVKLSVAMGRMGDALSTLAIEEEADLLVVGTHRRRGVGKLLSVSHHALRTAPCAVACVPSAAEQARVAPLRSALAATDLSPGGNAAIAQAAALPPPEGVLHVLHVADSSENASQRAAHRSMLLAFAQKRVAASTEVHVEVVTGRSAAEEILAASARLGVDLICVGTHQRSRAGDFLVGSVAMAVARGANRPVCMAPPPLQ